MLLAANHPNSFLDGMILTTLFDQPVHALARGDAFKNSIVNWCLRKIKLLPVYRTSEGVENLEHNYTTFRSCQKTFEQKGIVLIFSEGACVNEWHLRPLKKGTARLATSTWNMGIPLTVIPVAFNYSSFNSIGKEVHLFFGEPIDRNTVIQQSAEGRQLLSFNEQLHRQLHQLVYEIKPGNIALRRELFSIRKEFSFYILLLPGIAGCILHTPLYFICRVFAKRFTGTGHYDSVLMAALIIFYPFYLLLFILLLAKLGFVFCVLAFFLLPLTAWAAVETKFQADI